MNIQQFLSELAKKNILLTEEQKVQFEKYYALLLEWNDKINLTAITKKEEVYLKHFYDSLTASFFIDLKREPLTICDVGAGAGFPSIPLKIAFPHLKITIVDSLKKRITFLEELVKELQIDHVQLFHDRAENFGQNKDFRETFDIVTARAVAKMSVLSEFCLPLVKTGGTFLAMKGASGEEELADAKRAISLLGGQISSIHSLTLPIENSERKLIVIKKVKPTPSKYPRKPGIPIKSPL